MCSDNLPNREDFFVLVERDRARGLDGVEEVEEVDGERAGDLPAAVDEVLFLGGIVKKKNNDDGDKESVFIHGTFACNYTHVGC